MNKFRFFDRKVRPNSIQKSWTFRKTVKPTATTMLGRTNGTVIRALTSLCPGNDLLYKRYAPGIAIARVIKVEKAACHRVNRITSRVLVSESVASQSPEKPSEVILAIGQ